MILATLCLILPAAMFFYYFQVACQRILRRQFDREYFKTTASAVRLEFPALRKTLVESGIPVDYPRLRVMFTCDFLALTHLLRNTAKPGPRHSGEERLLMFYFRWQFLTLAAGRWLKVGERNTALRLASVLQYFANVLGQRVTCISVGA